MELLTVLLNREKTAHIFHTCMIGLPESFYFSPVKKILVIKATSAI